MKLNLFAILIICTSFSWHSDNAPKTLNCEFEVIDLVNYETLLSDNFDYVLNSNDKGAYRDKDKDLYYYFGCGINPYDELEISLYALKNKSDDRVRYESTISLDCDTDEFTISMTIDDTKVECMCYR